jgi:ABC-type branched-subunit amino acid transport system substrate-binding protein
MPGRHPDIDRQRTHDDTPGVTNTIAMIISEVAECKVKIVVRRERWLVVARRALVWLGPRRGTGSRLALALLACCYVAHAMADDDSVARGRRLFETGIGRNGQPVEAVFADSATLIPGALLSCAGCHGKDGRGRPVGGVDPPDITWQNLTKPYAVQARAGRSRLPYTEALVLRAVGTGRDSSNQPLGVAMPRFRLTPGDGADLLAYLRELGATADPGITAQAIAIGVVLPRREPTAELQDAVRAALESYRDDLNRAGGVFGRHIAFAFIDTAAASDPSQAAGQPLDQTILAAVASDVSAAPDVAALVSREVPLVAVRAGSEAPRPRVFYLSAGLPGELGALAAHAARELKDDARLTVLHTDDDAGRARVAALRGLLARNGGPAIDAVPLTGGSGVIADETIRRIQAGDAILLAGWDDRFAAILARLERNNPLVLLPGSLIDALPDTSGAPMRMLLAYESGAPSAQRETRPAAAQRTALAAARLMIEGLRRAGRDVSRARLVDAIETIRRFETGYGAPVSYSPQQHVGFTGAQIMRFDPHQPRSMQPIVRIELN